MKKKKQLQYTTKVRQEFGLYLFEMLFWLAWAPGRERDVSLSWQISRLKNAFELEFTKNAALEKIMGARENATRLGKGNDEQSK